MFNKDFYPTPLPVIERMLEGITLQGKTVLEPSAGKGDIVDYCAGAGAFLLACEINADLRKILAPKCTIIGGDFLCVTAEQISHVELIIMNPPFSADEKHILHAWEIAPDGCKIIALCNKATIDNQHTHYRKRLAILVDNQGSYEELGPCFTTAERSTDVEVALIQLEKPGGTYESEFEGFFLEEEQETQAEGIMPYNFIRDLVNRYVAAIKIYDEQLDAAVRMNTLTGQFFFSKLALSVTEEGKPKQRAEYKKDLQKAAWKYIFDKMNMEKYATRGLMADINRFVERQQNIPFTMRNIYRMLEIVIGTNETRMDRAILEVFDKLTLHHHDNRLGLEGWKTNSHYLLGQKFILPNLAGHRYSGGLEISHWQQSYEVINDLNKALCYLTGKNYDDIGSIWNHFNNKLDTAQSTEWKRVYVHYAFGEWHDFAFFRVKGFKKGSMHFQFRDLEAWAAFNQRVAKLKGLALFEGKMQTAYQNRNTGRKQNFKQAV